jgi:hypothetical protein
VCFGKRGGAERPLAAAPERLKDLGAVVVFSLGSGQQKKAAWPAAVTHAE